MHLGAPWDTAEPFGSRLVAGTPAGKIAFDFVIAGTGYSVELDRVPELVDFVDQIQLWSDRYTPAAADEQDETLGATLTSGPDLNFSRKNRAARQI